MRQLLLVPADREAVNGRGYWIVTVTSSL